MFNYSEIDKYITLKDLILIVKYLEEKKANPSFMISSIDRNGNEYTFHFTNAHHGHSHKFKIEDEKVIDLGSAGSWMS